MQRHRSSPSCGARASAASPGVALPGRAVDSPFAARTKRARRGGMVGRGPASRSRCLPLRQPGGDVVRRRAFRLRWQVPPESPPATGRALRRWVSDSIEQSLLYVTGGCHTDGSTVEGSGRLQYECARYGLLVAKHHQDRSLVEPIDRRGGEAVPHRGRIISTDAVHRRQPVSRPARENLPCRRDQRSMASLWPARRATAWRSSSEAIRSVQRRATAEQVRSLTTAAGKGMASR